jgi:cytochrome c-type protein NapC
MEQPTVGSLVALTCAVVAAAILVGYLVRRPPLHGMTKLWLLLGLGVLPISAAMIGNVEGYETTKQRQFCGSCHVMVLHTDDSNDPHSMSLAARHARNKLFGDENCYVCHADYGMFGTIATKIGGMRHVWEYYTRYRNVPVDDALKTIHLYKPYTNENCMQCHSTTLDLWLKTPDHRATLAALRTNEVSCASGGCHGFAHPFSKGAKGASLGAPNAVSGAKAALMFPGGG